MHHKRCLDDGREIHESTSLPHFPDIVVAVLQGYFNLMFQFDVTGLCTAHCKYMYNIPLVPVSVFCSQSSLVFPPKLWQSYMYCVDLMLVFILWFRCLVPRIIARMYSTQASDLKCRKPGNEAIFRSQLNLVWGREMGWSWMLWKVGELLRVLMKPMASQRHHDQDRYILQPGFIIICEVHL